MSKTIYAVVYTDWDVYDVVGTLYESHDKALEVCSHYNAGKLGPGGCPYFSVEMFELETE